MVLPRLQFRRANWSILAILCIAVLVIYLPVRGHEFLEPEDIVQVVANPRFERDLSLGAVVDQFRIRHPGDWSPLALLSLRVDAAVFGRDSAAPFLTINLLLHLLNSALLLAALRRLGTTTAVAGFVTLLFAVHPIQAETVATLGGRAELLGATFWMIALLLYTSRATGRLGPLRETGVLLCMVAGAAASSSVLFLPVVLLLLDLWPRGRTDWRHALMEKMPLFLVMTLGAVFLLTTNLPTTPGFDSTQSGPGHFANSVAAILLSFRDLLWPRYLSPFHVPPEQLSWTATLAGLGVLFGISIYCVRRAAALRTGWTWFLVLLAPALIFAGHELFFRADRWLYLPMIGIAWGLAGIVRRWNRMSLGLGAGLLLLLAFSAHAQVGVWRDTGTLCARAIEVDPDNWYAHARLGDLSRRTGAFRTAQEHYLIALGQVPGFAWAQTGLADAMAESGETEAAHALYENVLLTGWDDGDADRRLGFVLLRIHRDASAAQLLESALTRDRRSGDLQAGLALARARLGETDLAANHRKQSLQYGGLSVAGRNSLGWLLATAPEPALRDPGLALQIVLATPDTGRIHAESLDIKAAALAGQGRFAEAFATAQDASNLAENDGWAQFAAEIRDRARTYLQGETWTETRSSAPAAYTEVEEQGDGEDRRQDDPGHR